MADDREYCTFKLAGQTFGIDVLHVQEVIRPQRLTPVPLASPVVSGLMNLRGQIVTALDLRQRLGFPTRSGDSTMMNVVVRTAEDPLSLVVDDVGDVIRIPDDGLEAPPATLRGLPLELIRGVHPLRDQLLIVLNLNPLLETIP